MHEVSRDGEQVAVRVSVDELRLLVGTLNEAINGAYALPDEIWEDLIGGTPDEAGRLLEQITRIVLR